MFLVVRTGSSVSAKWHPDRVSNYAKYEKTLDVTNLTFPLAVNDIGKFEKLNTSIAIHCLARDRDNKGFSILYLSPYAHKRELTITLLLLDDPRNENRRHYVYVKNLSRLIAERSKHHSKCHVCLSCLHIMFYIYVVYNDDVNSRTREL